MVNRKVVYLLIAITLALLIGDFAYRVHIRPQGFPYDLLLVIGAVSLLGLSVMIPRWIADKDMLKRWSLLLMPAALLGGLTGFGIQVVSEYVSAGTIRWEKYLSNLYSMLAAFVIVLVVGLVIIGIIIRVRSKD